MICTECHVIFHENEIGIGEMFNCRDDIALVCSEKCRERITEKVNNENWMRFESYFDQRSNVSESA